MEDWGVSIYRLAAGSGANRFGGPKGARRPLAEIRKEIAAAQLAAWQKETKRVSKRIFLEGTHIHTHTDHCWIRLCRDSKAPPSAPNG